MARRTKDSGDTGGQPPVSSVKDELSEIIAKNLGKEFKDTDKVVWFLNSPEESPTDVTDWISTGSSILDLAISNRPNCGLPCGRISEITGLEGTGKSLMAAHVLAETQRRGGVAVFIDTEFAVSREFMQAIGVDLNTMLYIPLEKTEDIFKAMENIIVSARAAQLNKDKLVTIVVDSMAAATTEVESEADYSKDGWATTKAILLSKAMRKITGLIAKQKILVLFTNQLRMKMDASAFSDKFTTSGGKAIGFHSSVRVRLSSLGKIKKPDEDPIGTKIKAQVTKNRVGPPFRTAEFEMYFDSGLDNYSGWISVLLDKKIISKTGISYIVSLPDEDEPTKFMARDFAELMKTNSKLRDYLYSKLCDNLIMKYQKNGVTRADEELDVDADMTGVE